MRRLDRLISDISDASRLGAELARAEAAQERATEINALVREFGLHPTVKAVLTEIENYDGGILFIDEIHTVIGAGATSGGAMDASNLLKPALQGGKLRTMGSTTYKEFRQHFEKDRALARRFQKIDVNEPSVEDAVKILRGIKPYFEDHHSVKYTSDAIRTSVELAHRYINDRKLPDSAIDVIDEAGAAQHLLAASKRRKTIGTKEVEAVVAKIARIPPKNVSKDDVIVLKDLEASLKRVVFGQDKAIEALSSAIKLARAGLREPEKPIGNYLFAGPTGVGKTEVAKALRELGAEVISADEVAHETYRRGTQGWREVVAEFGEDVSCQGLGGAVGGRGVDHPPPLPQEQADHLLAGPDQGRIAAHVEGMRRTQPDGGNPLPAPGDRAHELGAGGSGIAPKSQRGPGPRRQAKKYAAREFWPARTVFWLHILLRFFD